MLLTKHPQNLQRDKVDYKVCDTAIGDVSNTLTAGLPKGESPLGGLIAGVTSAVGDLVGAVGGAIKTGLGTAQDLFEDLTGNISNKLQSSLGGFALDKDFLSTIMKDVMEGGISISPKHLSQLH